MTLLEGSRGVQGCDGSLLAFPCPEEIRGLLAKTEEAVDHLLDISEPERTRFVVKVTSMQDDLRRLLAKA